MKCKLITEVEAFSLKDAIPGRVYKGDFGTFLVLDVFDQYA